MTPFHVGQLVSPFIIAGSLIATEGADTVAAAGSPVLAATLAATEGADTVAAAGTLTITGTAPVVEAGDVVSLAGGYNPGVITVIENRDVVDAGQTVTLEWIDRYGVRNPWPIGKLQGIQGVGLPPVQVMSQRLAARPGEKRTAAKWLARPVTVPFNLSGDTEPNVRTALRSWAHLLDPSIDGGSLLVGPIGLGTPRRLYCRYTGGLELTTDFEHVVEEMIQFEADDPFFYDFTPSDGRVDGAPFTVGGDVPTWPIVGVKNFDDSTMTASYTLTTAVGNVGFSTGLAARKAYVLDFRPATRGLWATTTVHVDPLISYLAGDTDWNQQHDSTISGTWAAPYEVRWFQIPFDPYSPTGVFNNAPGVAQITSSASGAPGFAVWHLGYYKAWLTQ